MSLPKTYNGDIMKLKLIDESIGIYETSTRNRQFKVEIDENGNITMKAHNVKELSTKLQADQIKYGTQIPRKIRINGNRQQVQKNINDSVDLLVDVANTNTKPQVEKEHNNNENYTSKKVTYDNKTIVIRYYNNGKIDINMTVLNNNNENIFDVSFEKNKISYVTNPNEGALEGSFIPNKSYNFNQLLKLAEQIFGTASAA